jgi:threonyl-tRNA synthetase
MLIVGDKEVEANTVSIRLRSGEQLQAQSFDSFIQKISAEIAGKK